MVSPIVIGGPTGSGKSDYALKLAQEIGGEIICADSRQVYQFMKIGSASPTAEECEIVPHHNYNCIDPKNTYDAGDFIADTDAKVAEILGRQRVPIIVGGTGMYLRSWHFGLSDVPEKNPEIREELQDELLNKGLPALYEELKIADADAAQKIGPNDEFRVLRALEIYRLTGRRPSELRKSHFGKPRIKADWRLLRPSREILNSRLLERTKKMFAIGLVDEAVALRNYLPIGHKLLETIGYKESLQFVDGDVSKDAAIELTFIRTRQYAKRQEGWFSKENYWRVVS